MNKPRIKLYEWNGKRVKYWICIDSDGKFGLGHTPQRAYDFWYYGLDEMIKRLGL